MTKGFTHFYLMRSLLLVPLLLSILIIEITFRLIEYDFSRKKQAFESTPIYYRQPIVPVGEVFFRRPGPDIWRGAVLSTGLRMAGGLDKAYVDEKEVTIIYDGKGFRNVADLNNWEVVVVGDSFVELGYLPYNELFTTQMETFLGVRVKNLGVSNTGPLTYIFYLREYGKSRDTKHAIMVFSENNDLMDLKREQRELETYQISGKREYRDPFEKQPSFLKGAYSLLKDLMRNGQTGMLFHDAYFRSANGEIPVSINYVPPDPKELTDDRKSLLEMTLVEWSRTAKRMGMASWVVYMPTKIRSLHGYFKVQGERVTKSC